MCTSVWRIFIFNFIQLECKTKSRRRRKPVLQIQQVKSQSLFLYEYSCKASNGHATVSYIVNIRYAKNLKELEEMQKELLKNNLSNQQEAEDEKHWHCEYKKLKANITYHKF